MSVPILQKNPVEVRTGPGWALVGPANPTEPTWVATAGKFTNDIPGYYSWGYSAAGFTLSFGNKTTATLTPAEELEPIRIVTTGQDPTTISFDLFGVNEVVTRYAMNGGTWATVSGTGATQVRRYTPPDVNSEVRCSIIFISSDQDELYWFPQMYQTGSVTRTFTKGDTPSGYTGLVFSTEKPPTGASWNYLTSGEGFAGPPVSTGA